MLAKLSDLASLPKANAAFIEPMLLLRTEMLPEGAEWLYELFCGRPHNNSKTPEQISRRSTLEMLRARRPDVCPRAHWNWSRIYTKRYLLNPAAAMRTNGAAR